MQQENILPLHLPPQQSVGKRLAEILEERFREGRGLPTVEFTAVCEGGGGECECDDEGEEEHFQFEIQFNQSFEVICRVTEDED